jgi:4-hydroxy-3-polyprenylbenzoate decarboxylase
MHKKILIAITGASGQVYAKEILEMLDYHRNQYNKLHNNASKTNLFHNSDNPPTYAMSLKDEEISTPKADDISSRITTHKRQAQNTQAQNTNTQNTNIQNTQAQNTKTRNTNTQANNANIYAEKIEVHVVMTDTAKEVWQAELPNTPLPRPLLDNSSFYHPFASGSNCADVMIIAPSTMGTIGRIASGVSSDLITRAADVMLKERKPLIIVPRENPYNLIHLRNMTTLTEAGAVIAPASPEFYTQPTTLEELTKNMANRILHLAGITPLETSRKFFTTA